ncbi:AMP-dependent synthetase/ligase [Geomonas sp.]|uniref:AMP-dependent synthetase/ligase n=1 Tax=Geomonas sp. TaxID=2651584 RepID=UPI002B4639CA|nr:AMP-binding protein [Geomonas sp.]
MIAATCRAFDSRTAMLQKRDGRWRETSYGELGERSVALAAALAGRGFSPGERAALLAASSPEWVMAYLGVLQGGGVVVPVDRELREIELSHILSHSEARLLFVDLDRLPLAVSLAQELPALELIVVLPPEENRRYQVASRCTVLSLADLLSNPAGRIVPPAASDTALILYTSGTTGRSKGAMLSHANIVSNIRGAARHLEVDQSVHTLSFLPINHVFEQVCGVLVPLSLGGKVSFCESLKKLGDNLAEVRPTFFVGVPAVYRMMLGRVMKGIEERRLARLLWSLPFLRGLITGGIRKKLGDGTTFISGGAALDPAVAAGFGELGMTLLQGYGITETAPVIAAESPSCRRVGSVGRMLEGVEVRIACPDLEGVGEIQVKGPNVMQGYFRDPQASSEAIVDGWYRTGDLGRLEDGFLYICGRVKSLIVTPNGKNVYPEEVEIEILKSSLVAEAVVYARKSGEVAEEICAVVRPDQEALEEYAASQGRGALADAQVEQLIRKEVAEACQRLASYKRVKQVTICRQEFPKTTTRKIKRFEVEALMAAGSM